MKNTNNLQYEFMLKSRRKLIRKMVVYNIRNTVIDYVAYRFT